MKVHSVLAAAVLLVVVGCIEGQAHSVNAIRGAVVDSDGTMVDRFTVVVRPWVVNKPVLVQRRRFSDGIFSVAGLERQKYEIIVSAPKYIGVHLNVEFPKNGGSTEFKVVVLHRFPSGKYFPGSPFDESEGDPIDYKVPEVARLSYRSAAALYRDGRLEDALAAYGDAIRLAPNYVAPIVDAGVVYLLLNRPDAGLIFLRRAEELAPKDRTIKLNIAVGLMIKNDLHPAIKLLESVARDVRDKSVPHVLLARAYYIAKKYPQAEKMARSALEEDPAMLEARQILFTLAFERQNYAAARENLLKLRDVLNNQSFSRLVDDQITKMVGVTN